MAVHRLPDVRNSQREASEWIARLHSDTVSDEDIARFEAWKRADPVNVAAYESLSRTWRRFERAGPSVQPVAPRERVSPRSMRRAGLPWLALAATVIVTAFLLGHYLDRPAVPSVFSTRVGEQATIPLADGSTMALNSNSVARIQFSARRRIVHLERGEAFFTVAHDASRPFWVTGDSGWVRAVGTQFDVYRKASGLRVTVSEGSIRVGGNPRVLATEQADEARMPVFATLSAGQQAEVAAGSATTRELSDEDLSRAIAWRGGTVYFENQPLADVVAELNRYTARPIVLENAQLGALPVGGTFQASPQGAEALLRLLEQSFHVNVQRNATRAVVRGGSSSPSH